MIRFLTNETEQTIVTVECYFGELPHEALDRWKRWRAGKIIGDPQPTPFFSVEQLKAFGSVGVYVECTPKDAVDALSFSVVGFKMLASKLTPPAEKEDSMLNHAHHICRAFGEILYAGYPLVIETINGRQYSVSSPPVLEGNSVLVFGDYSIEISKIRSIRLEALDA